MPRTARIQQQALCYHVMNRGVNKQQVFTDDQDRHYFIKRLSSEPHHSTEFQRAIQTPACNMTTFQATFTHTLRPRWAVEKATANFSETCFTVQ